MIAAWGGIEPPTSSGKPFQAVVNRRCGPIKPYPFNFYSMTSPTIPSRTLEFVLIALSYIYRVSLVSQALILEIAGPTTRVSVLPPSSHQTNKGLSKNSVQSYLSVLSALFLPR